MLHALRWKQCLGPNGRSARPVIKKIHDAGVNPNPLRGLFSVTIAGKPAVVEHEPVPARLRRAPLLEEAGIEACLHHKPLPLPPLGEIRADILVLERETEGLLGEIVG